jgi:tRNA modification GTPase
VRVTLTDTAGLRAGGDEVESEGVARARAALEQSVIVLWVVDAAVPLDEVDRGVAARLSGRRVLVALNKRDLPQRVRAEEVTVLLGEAPGAVVAVSATRGDGIADLLAALGRLLAGPEGLGGAVANRRHAEALECAHAALARARAAAAAGAPGEIVALELNEALAALGEVTGETVREDVLERIFSRFCVGK